MNLFPFFQMCQKDINTHRQGYNAFCSTGQRIIDDCTGSLSSQAAMELDRVSRRWVMITNRVTSNQQQLELSLKDWQEYTSLTENLMVWLRENEKLLRVQSKAITVRDVERELDAMKVLHDTVLVFAVCVVCLFFRTWGCPEAIHAIPLRRFHIDNSLHWKVCSDIICSEKRTFFQERSSRETVSIEKIFDEF